MLHQVVEVREASSCKICLGHPVVDKTDLGSVNFEVHVERRVCLLVRQSEGAYLVGHHLRRGFCGDWGSLQHIERDAGSDDANLLLAKLDQVLNCHVRPLMSLGMSAKDGAEDCVCVVAAPADNVVSVPDRFDAVVLNDAAVGIHSANVLDVAECIDVNLHLLVEVDEIAHLIRL